MSRITSFFKKPPSRLDEDVSPPRSHGFLKNEVILLIVTFYILFSTHLIKHNIICAKCAVSFYLLMSTMACVCTCLINMYFTTLNLFIVQCYYCFFSLRTMFHFNKAITLRFAAVALCNNTC